MILIGISGKKKSGKDTVGQYISNIVKQPGKVERIAYADALKEEVAKACSVTVKEVEEKKDIYRPILQWWGTEFRRKLFSEYYWIHKLLFKIKMSTADIVYVPDVRFINEASVIKSVGGILIRVERPRQDTFDNHPSETELDNYQNFDYTIQNNLDLPHLKTQTKLILQQILNHANLHTTKLPNS